MPSTSLKVAFAGTPEFAAHALECLLRAGFVVPLVLTQPDRPAGRGLKLQASPVRRLALQHSIAVAQPLSLRLDGKYPDEAQAAREALLQAAPDVMVVAAYGLILPRWTLELPRLGCINIHASLLPRWRGAAPIQRAIEAGDRETGITLMQMDEGLDTGNMLMVQATDISDDDTAARLHDRLAVMGGEMIVQALQGLAQGPLPASPQPGEGISYARKIEKAEATIAWSQSAEEIERRIRAFDPFPGANFLRGGEVIKAWQACLYGDREAAQAIPGTVIDLTPTGPVVACGSGALLLQTLQRPGGRRQGALEALRQEPLRVGEVLQQAP